MQIERSDLLTMARAINEMLEREDNESTLDYALVKNRGKLKPTVKDTESKIRDLMELDSRCRISFALRDEAGKVKRLPNGQVLVPQPGENEEFDNALKELSNEQDALLSDAVEIELHEVDFKHWNKSVKGVLIAHCEPFLKNFQG